jgi:hypothetical protein
MSCAISGRSLFVVLAEHAQDGGRGGVPAFLLSRGDDEAGGDIAQAQLLAAQVEGHGEHGVVLEVADPEPCRSPSSRSGAAQAAA